MANKRKTYPSNSEIAHAWANWDTAEECRAGNMIVRGDTIYSYGSHFPIATRLPGNVFLLTTDTYSVTTARHITEVYRAIHGTIFNVLDVEVWNNPRDKFTAHASNVHGMCERIKRLYERHLGAKKFSCKSEIQNVVAEMANYCTHFELGNPPEVMTAEMWAKVEEKEEKIRVYKEQEAERERIKRDKRIVELAKRIPLWRRGESGIGMLSLRDLPCMLRLSPDGERVQTSWGASVSVRAFMTAYKVMRKNGFESLISTKVEAFGVTAINAEEVVIGCHRISMNEVYNVADKINEKENEKDQSAILYSEE